MKQWLSIAIALFGAGQAAAQTFDARWQGDLQFLERWAPLELPRHRSVTSSAPPAAASRPRPDVRGQLYDQWRKWGTHAAGPKIGRVAIFADAVGWIVALPDAGHVTVRTRSRTLTRPAGDVVEYREGP